jgi:CubicO group peptidase (beta-lactamase class C family)
MTHRFNSLLMVLPWGAPRAVLYGLLALLTVACTVVPVTEQVPAQDKFSEIDQLFSWATSETPGCAVAVSQNGEVVVNRAYGIANLERKVPISPSTMFDVGSVQKQFVAAAILLLVEDGHLSLSDDIREYFPELPDYGHAITVDHLLTHTSGLRDWTALLQLSSESEDALTLIFRQRGLNFAPGEEWSYSNSGYVLLKELVARTTGMPFSKFAHERLFEPLGMETTTYADDVRDVKERALAYENEGDGWSLNILVGNERGDGGGLLSTASDLLIWNEALTNARLGAYVTEKLQEPAQLNNGRELRYARGLFLDENPASRIVWHSGSAAAYKTLLARLPEQGLSIATLCNAGETAGEQNFANRIIELFVPDMREPDAEATESVATAGATGAPDPSGRAGLFFSERTGDPLRLVVQSGKLHVDDGPELVSVAHDRYRNEQRSLTFMSDDEVELHFLSLDEFILTASQGETTHYHRAQPYAPTAADLEAFVGRYESDDLRAVLDFALADDDLTVRLNGSRPFAFTPVDRDTFQLGRMLVRFLRDEDGKVVALDYSNPVLRNVRFTR